MISAAFHDEMEKISASKKKKQWGALAGAGAALGAGAIFLHRRTPRTRLRKVPDMPSPTPTVAGTKSAVPTAGAKQPSRFQPPPSGMSFNDDSLYRVRLTVDGKGHEFALFGRKLKDVQDSSDLVTRSVFKRSDMSLPDMARVLRQSPDIKITYDSSPLHTAVLKTGGWSR